MRLTDGQTEGQTEFSSLDRVCIPCSAVKTTKFGANELETSLYRTVQKYSDIAYRLGVTHECDGQTDINQPQAHGRFRAYVWQAFVCVAGFYRAAWNADAV